MPRRSQTCQCRLRRSGSLTSAVPTCQRAPGKLQLDDYALGFRHRVSVEGKVAISLGRVPESEEEAIRSYLLTQIRRGRLVKEKASGKPKLTCRNWECGIVVPVVGEHAANGSDRQVRDGDMLGMFERCVPVPMQTPGAPFVDMSSNGSRSSGSGSSGNVQLRPWCLG